MLWKKKLWDSLLCMRTCTESWSSSLKYHLRISLWSRAKHQHKNLPIQLDSTEAKIYAENTRVSVYIMQKHSMEVTKLPTRIYTKSTKCKRALRGFNCSRSSLESYRECRQASLCESLAKIPVLGDCTAHLAQMHLFCLMETYWRIFNCRSPTESLSSTLHTPSDWNKSEDQCKNLYPHAPHSLRYPV